MTDAKVKIYTTSACQYCVIAKEFFDNEGIKYEEVNVQENQDAAKEMVQKSGQMGVPVIEINGQIIVGFNKPAIMEALGK